MAHQGIRELGRWLGHNHPKQTVIPVDNIGLTGDGRLPLPPTPIRGSMTWPPRSTHTPGLGTQDTHTLGAGLVTNSLWPSPHGPHPLPCGHPEKRISCEQVCSLQRPYLSSSPSPIRTPILGIGPDGRLWASRSSPASQELEAGDTRYCTPGGTHPHSPCAGPFRPPSSLQAIEKAGIHQYHSVRSPIDFPKFQAASGTSSLLEGINAKRVS